MAAVKRRLAAHVWVHRADGDPVLLGPDDDVPAWAAEQIRNPKAWADGTAPVDETEPVDPGNSDPAAAEGNPFDPSEHSVDEVLAYLTGLGDDEAAEYERVIAAERAGKARKTIIA